jgi:uncharacterized protein YceK
MRMRNCFTLLVIVVLAGCATRVSEVTPLGGGLYMVGANARTGIDSDAEVMGQAIKRATAYCEATGKRVHVEATNATGIQGLTPRNADVRFSCD